MHSLPSVPAHRRGVFTLAEALIAGWTIDALRHGMRAGALVRLRRGCFVPPVPSELSRFEAADLELVRQTIAATLAARDIRASHLGAAILVGLPAWAPTPRVCVTTPRDCALRGVDVHHALPRRGHFGLIGDISLTAPWRTVVDVAREFGAESGLVLADAAVRTGLATMPDLAATVEELGEDLDVSAARCVVAMVDPTAESPLESRSRWHLVQHGVPPPRSQVEIFATSGEFIGRTDFFWPAGVVGEVDGSAKYGDPSVLAREKWRQERLEELGLQVVRWGAHHLRDFGPTAARLRRALARADQGDRDRLWVAGDARVRLLES